MTDPFRGYAVFQGYVESVAGDLIPVPMPSDVQAGDYIFVVGGQYDLNVVGFTTTEIGDQLRSFGAGDSSDFELLCQNPDIFVKLADGTEGGTTVNFETQDTTGFTGHHRTCTLISMCYRFEQPPIPNALPGTSIGPNLEFIVSQFRFFGGSGATADSSVDYAGPPNRSYPGPVTTPAEFRLIATMGASDLGEEGPEGQLPLESAEWYGVNNRTGMRSLPRSEDGLLEAHSLTVADHFLFGYSDPPSGIRVSGNFNVNAFVHSVTALFPCLTEVQVGTCPTYVAFQDSGNGTAFAGEGDVLMPYHDAGMLLLYVACSNDDTADIGPPPGWNVLFNESWGIAPQIPPGPNPDPIQIWLTDHANAVVAWKIADGSEPAENDVLYSIVQGTAGSPPGSASMLGAEVYSYACFETCTDERIPFPDPPIKYAGMGHVDPEFDADATRATDAPGEVATWGSQVSFATPTADWIGNHVYFAMSQVKGHAWAWYAATTPPNSPYAWTGLNAENTLPPSERRINQGGTEYQMIRVAPEGTPGSVPMGGPGQVGWEFKNVEGCGVWLWSSGDSVFWDINVNQSYSSDGACFVADSKMTDHYELGYQEIYADSSVHNDGFLGTLHVDFEDWAYKHGLACRSFVIQAPESYFPPNDTAETAFYIGSCCPLEVHECVFAARSEGGPQVEGTDPCADVWFSFTATTTSISFDTLGSDYFTVVGVYDSGLNLIGSNKDEPPYGGAQATTSLAIGATYYVQITSWNNFADQTCLTLNITCEGLNAYWGILHQDIIP